jgi:hypothetical protein
VPSENEHWALVMLRKVKWAAISSVMPEVVTLNAFLQLSLAYQYSLSMRRLGYTNWTITHSFAVMMGAIVLEIPGHDDFKRVRMNIAMNDVIEHAKTGGLPFARIAQPWVQPEASFRSAKNQNSVQLACSTGCPAALRGPAALRSPAAARSPAALRCQRIT